MEMVPYDFAEFVTQMFLCPADENDLSALLLVIGHCLRSSTASHTQHTVAILVQVASAGLELDCRCHGEEGEEEMQQAQMQE